MAAKTDCYRSVCAGLPGHCLPWHCVNGETEDRESHLEIRVKASTDCSPLTPTVPMECPESMCPCGMPMGYEMPILTSR